MHETLRVADEVWIAAALLHRRHPGREDFTVAEIVGQAKAEKATGAASLRPGVQVHASQHCVANKKPNPDRYRMLVETSKGRRRLFRPGDPCHPGRRSGKDIPLENDIPAVYRNLIDWYHKEYAGADSSPAGPTAILSEATNPSSGYAGVGSRPVDPILSLRGLGKKTWADEDADAYVRRLREAWGEPDLLGY